MNQIALLCTDIIVFVKEPADKSDQSGPVDLCEPRRLLTTGLRRASADPRFLPDTVLRLTNGGPDKPPPVTLFGSGNSTPYVLPCL